MARAARISAAVVVLAAAIAGGLWVFWWRQAPPAAPPGAVGPPAGGELVSSIRAEPRTFNRYVSRDSVSETVSHLTQARLIRLNRLNQQVEPWLADSWTRSADGLTYTLSLGRNIQFSDGTPFSSADVLFAFRAIYDERTGSPLADSMKVGGQALEVSAPDEGTIVLKFPSPFGPGLRLLDNLPILPRHKLEPALAAGTLAEAWGVNSAPADIVGLGPFKLTRYDPGQRLVFERNPYYWRKDEAGRQLPYLFRLSLEIVPDQNAELLRLEAGQIDFTQSEIRADDYATLKRAADAGRITLHDLGVGLDPDALWFNLNPSSKSADPARPWLRTSEFRRAIAHAVDRKAFIETVFRGAAIPVSGPVTEANTRWHAANVPTYDYAPGESRRLLEGLGLRDRDNDGVAENDANRAARFTLVTQKGNSSLERGAAVVRDDLARVGVVIDVVPLEVGSLYSRVEHGEYEAVYARFLTTDLDPALNLDFWMSRGGGHVWYPSQPAPATDWERRIDALMAEQVAALDDARRKELFDQVQQIFAEQVPILYFAAPRIFVATSSRVMGATPSVLRPAILWNPEVLAVRATGAPGAGR